MMCALASEKWQIETLSSGTAEEVDANAVAGDVGPVGRSAQAFVTIAAATAATVRER